MSVLDGLNPAQRQGAEITEGPLLVLAGAGSGKTRVLTYRIAHLIKEKGVAPWNILAVTFTNKASGEMRERIEKLVGPDARGIMVGTFHAICARLLRTEAANFGLDTNFSIYDEDDRRALMRRVLKNMDIAEDELPPRAAIRQISSAKNAMLDPRLYAREGEDTDRHRRLTEVYTTYEAGLRQNNALDFDDLLVETVRQFDSHPEVLEKYQDRYRYVLVDEYQDTNKPQYLLTKQLSAKYRNLCCVGDDDQSIYKFRGADIRNILDFERDYPEAKTVRLEQNYRSTGRILAAANAVIRNNNDRKGKELWTAGAQGDPIAVVECESDRSEARFVVTTLRSQLLDGHALSDAALLYRTNAQSRALEEELQRANMDYVIVGGIRFYERKEIKDLLSYMRSLVNHDDDISLRRILNTPKRGIGDSSIEKLQAFARQRGMSMWNALEHLPETDLGARALKSMEAFRQLMRGLGEIKETYELPAFGQEIYERSGYLASLEEDRSPESEARQENISQLLADLTEFSQTHEDPSLELFLEEKSLMSSQDSVDASKALTLMTMHSAKGLEYPLVFICGIEQNLFPTSRAIEEGKTNPKAIEEERRLFYVGITRAEKRLWLTHARWRFAYGTRIEAEPSIFLDEVPDDLIVRQSEGKREERRGSAPKSTAPRGFKASPVRRVNVNKPPQREKPAPKGVHYEWEEPANASHIDEGQADDEDFLSVGRWVLHPNWGRGMITGREGEGEKTKVSIRFGSKTKRILVAYATLEPA
jgi:DNA helicase II / ATP-dependent DNA helicase PcrA